MKRIIKVMSIILLLATFCVAMGGCGEDVVYTGSTRFMYSTDAGASWSETIQEIEVNTTYYLGIEMEVSQSKEEKGEQVVVAKVTIPNTNVLDCYLDDHPGVSITGVTDPIDGTSTYSFNVVADTSPSRFRVIFECTPLAEGKASIYVVYDDLVSSNWDATGTIKYVINE